MSDRFVSLFALLLLVPTPVPAVEADPALPNDAQVVASVNVRHLLDAAVVKKSLAGPLEDALPRGQELPELAKALGVQPLQDIDRVLIAGPLTLEPDRFLLVAHGRFKVKNIEAAAHEFAKKSPEVLRLHEGEQHTIYEYIETNRKLPPLFVCVLDKETIVASTGKDTVLDALAKKTGKKKSALASELQKLLGKVDGKATVWVVGLATPEVKKRLAAPAEYQRLVDSLQHFRGSVTVADGVQADFVVQTNDAKAAPEIRKFMEGVKAILILAATSQDKKNGVIWADLLSALKVANEQDAVTLRGEVTAEQVEKSVQNRGK